MKCLNWYSSHILKTGAMMMKVNRICMRVLSACLLCGAVFAEQKTITLDDAVQMASANNISIQKSRITLETLKRANIVSWNSISPSVSVSANYSQPNEQTSYKYSESLTGSVSVALTPALYSSMMTAYLNYKNGQITYDQAVRSVEMSVRKTFYGLLYEKENIALQQRNLDTAKQQYDQNTAKYQNGQVSELDMLTSQVSYEKLKPAVQSAQLTYSSDLASFKQVLGIDQTTDVSLSGSLDDALLLKEISVAADTSSLPSVQSAANSVKIAQASLVAKSFSAYGPSFTAGWTYGKQKYDFSDTANTTGSFSLGVSIPLDGILPWSSGMQSVAAANDSLKSAKLSLENEKTTAEVQVANYINQIGQAESQLASLKANIDLAQKTYDMTQRAYNLGSKDLLSLQSAADSLMTAKVSFASQEYTLISAVLSLENILGVPFGTLGK